MSVTRCELHKWNKAVCRVLKCFLTRFLQGRNIAPHNLWGLNFFDPSIIMSYLSGKWEQSHTIANGSDHCSSIWQLAPRKGMNYKIPLVHPGNFRLYTLHYLNGTEHATSGQVVYISDVFYFSRTSSHWEPKYINRKLEIYCEMRRKIKKTTWWWWCSL